MALATWRGRNGEYSEVVGVEGCDFRESDFKAKRSQDLHVLAGRDNSSSGWRGWNGKRKCLTLTNVIRHCEHKIDIDWNVTQKYAQLPPPQHSTAHHAMPQHSTPPPTPLHSTTISRRCSNHCDRQRLDGSNWRHNGGKGRSSPSPCHRFPSPLPSHSIPLPSLPFLLPIAVIPYDAQLCVAWRWHKMTSADEKRRQRRQRRRRLSVKSPLFHSLPKKKSKRKKYNTKPTMDSFSGMKSWIFSRFAFRAATRVADSWEFLRILLWESFKMEE